ncbi:hypothetical protein BRC90_04310 [Halobacteriales archaeon QS_4_69_34]|nr:MAG: hypothetical protein BRC90_04310 [Halobacteriales archaeon QS_4_69_34]
MSGQHVLDEPPVVAVRGIDSEPTEDHRGARVGVTLDERPDTLGGPGVVAPTHGRHLSPRAGHRRSLSSM